MKRFYFAFVVLLCSFSQQAFSSAVRDTRFSLGKMVYYDPGCHMTGEETVLCGGQLYKKVRAGDAAADLPLDLKPADRLSRVTENEK